MLLIQVGCECIFIMLLLFVYILLLYCCVWMFCVLLLFGLVSLLGWGMLVLLVVLVYVFFGLDQLGEEMEDLFGLELNDLLLDVLVCMIEIDQFDVFGECFLFEFLLLQGYLL